MLFGNVGSDWANMRLSESERPPSGQDVGLVGECIALKVRCTKLLRNI